MFLIRRHGVENFGLHEASDLGNILRNMGEQSDPQSALVEFIAECFTSDELVRFVRSLSEGASLSLDMLQPPASIRDIAFHLVRMLERRALLDHTLFSALAQERPRQLERINLMMLSLLPGPGPVPKSLEGMLLCGGRYRMEELAAYGGFATLWRAWDNVTKSYVAIKILSREVPAKDYMWRRQRFITGTRRIAGLEHPHIARVLDAHRYEQGYDYCVQEYVEGHQLHKQIAARRLDSPIDIAASLLDIGEALALMHENGILHGDVSPKNIIIRPETGKFQAVLVDFDLVYAPAQDSMTVPTHGMPFTDPYSAPEWKAGLDQLDSRADIFSLGMTLVAIFAGCKPPASLNDPAAMDPGAFINKLSCNPLIRETLYKACSLDRNRRYTNMRALCSDLRRALSEAQVWRASGRSFAEGQRALDAAKPVEPEPPLLPTAMPVAAPRTRQTDVTRGPSFEYEWLKTTKNGVVRPRLLGSGRFGKVFAALQTSATMPARPVAIKLLHDHADLRHERLFHQEIMLNCELSAQRNEGFAQLLDVLTLDPLVMCACGVLYTPHCPRGCDLPLQRGELTNRPSPSLMCPECNYMLSAEFVQMREHELYCAEAKPCCKVDSRHANLGAIINFVTRQAVVLEMNEFSLEDYVACHRPPVLPVHPAGLLERIGLMSKQMQEQSLRQKSDLREKLNIMIQIVEFIAWLHDAKKVVHKDLAPNNIMLRRICSDARASEPSLFGTASGYQARVIDFGLSDRQTPSRSWYEDAEHIGPPAEQVPYLSPEAQYHIQVVDTIEIDAAEHRFRIPASLDRSYASIRVQDILADPHDADHVHDLVVTRIEISPGAKFAYVKGEVPSKPVRHYVIIRPLGEAHDVYALGAIFYFLLTGSHDQVFQLGMLAGSVQESPCRLTWRALQKRDTYLLRRNAILYPSHCDDLMEIVLRAMVRGRPESYASDRSTRSAVPVLRLLTELRLLRDELIAEMVTNRNRSSGGAGGTDDV